MGTIEVYVRPESAEEGQLLGLFAPNDLPDVVEMLRDYPVYSSADGDFFFCVSARQFVYGQGQKMYFEIVMTEPLSDNDESKIN